MTRNQTLTGTFDIKLTPEILVFATCWDARETSFPIASIGLASHLNGIGILSDRAECGTETDRTERLFYFDKSISFPSNGHCGLWRCAAREAAHSCSWDHISIQANSFPVFSLRINISISKESHNTDRKVCPSLYNTVYHLGGTVTV